MQDSGRWWIYRGGERVHLKGNDPTLPVEVQVEMDEDSLFNNTCNIHLNILISWLAHLVPFFISSLNYPSTNKTVYIYVFLTIKSDNKAVNE